MDPEKKSNIRLTLSSTIIHSRSLPLNFFCPLGVKPYASGESRTNPGSEIVIRSKHTFLPQRSLTTIRSARNAGEPEKNSVRGEISVKQARVGRSF